MTPNDKPRFAMLHKRLTDAYPVTRGDADFMAACAAALEPFPIEVVEAAYHEAAHTPLFGAFPPNPGQLAGVALDFMAKAGEKAPEAWAHEWFAFIVARFPELRGPDNNRVDLRSKYDAQASQAVKDCGGLGVMLLGKEGVARERFVKAYCKLEPNYQDAPARPLRPDEDPARPWSPTRGRTLKLVALAAQAAASEAQAEIGCQGLPRDVAGLIRGLVKHG